MFYFRYDFQHICFIPLLDTIWLRYLFDQNIIINMPPLYFHRIQAAISKNNLIWFIFVHSDGYYKTATLIKNTLIFQFNRKKMLWFFIPTDKYLVYTADNYIPTHIFLGNLDLCLWHCSTIDRMVVNTSPCSISWELPSGNITAETHAIPNESCCV